VLLVFWYMSTANPKLRQALVDNSTAVPALVRLLPAAAAALPAGLGSGMGNGKGKGNGKGNGNGNGKGKAEAGASEALLKGATAALSNCLLSESAAAAGAAKFEMQRPDRLS
jgi:hypothetical protein